MAAFWPMTVAQAVLAAAVMAVGAGVQGAVGFGSNLIAAPLLVLIDPAFVPGPTSVASVVLNLLLTMRERAEADRRELRIAIIGLVPGTVLGAAALAATDDRSLGLLIAATVVLGVLLTASGIRVPMTAPWIGLAGAVSGFGGTAAGIGGPPLALLHQHRKGPVIRATLARLFLTSSIMTIIGLLAFGRFGWASVGRGAVLLPGSLLGFAVSKRAARVLDRGYTRPAILLLSTVSAVAVVVTRL
jgi:uncharacterized membrane protein YfcA